jgi:hypothetical protein
VFALLFSALTLGLYSGYYYQSLRFMAPLVPLVALGIGAGVASALRRLRDGARQGNWWWVGSGSGFCLMALAGMVSSLGPALRQCFAYQHYVRHSRSLYEFPWHSATAAAYRRALPPGSIIATDVLPPLLDEAGIVAGNVVLPFIRKGYWASPHLRSLGTFEERQDFVWGAVRQGRGVYTDSYSLEGLRERVDSNVELNRSLGRYQLAAIAREGPVTIYRLQEAPCDSVALLDRSCGNASGREIEGNDVPPAHH